MGGEGAQTNETAQRPRVPRVNSVEGPRWSTLVGRMTPERRREALRQVAEKMRTPPGQGGAA